MAARGVLESAVGLFTGVGRGGPPTERGDPRRPFSYRQPDTNPPSPTRTGDFAVSLGSERCFVELHDLVVDRVQHRAGAGEQRQEVLREERRNRDLALE